MAVNFGKRLQILREEQGISQSDLAERSGQHRQSISKIERGERMPTWATVVALAKALGVTPNDFLDDQITS